MSARPLNHRKFLWIVPGAIAVVRDSAFAAMSMTKPPQGLDLTPSAQADVRTSVGEGLSNSVGGPAADRFDLKKVFKTPPAPFATVARLFVTPEGAPGRTVSAVQLDHAGA